MSDVATLPPWPTEEILAAGRPIPDGETIGASREGRPIRGHRIGEGDLRVSLIGGCHADEPVGPRLLDLFAAFLASRPASSDWQRRYRWILVPHANPDGEARNLPWTGRTVPVRNAAGSRDEGYELAAYLDQVVREAPGDDVEFGFPRGPDDGESRPENRAIAELLGQEGPFAMHASLHGMGLAHGPWFLLEPFWLARTARLRLALAERVADLGHRLHDVDRGGEKGFWRIAEGFTTRPDSRAMRDHFLARGEPEEAARFRPSSMELARRLGGDPLTLVSEMPLFLLPADGPLADPSLPRPALMEALHRAHLEHGDRVDAATGIRPMPLGDQMRLQLALLEEGVRAAMGDRPPSTPAC